MTESTDSIARRLAAIVESSDDAIVSKDLNGIVLSWNQAAERMFGYTADEMIGTSIRRIIPDDRQSEEDAVLAAIRAGRRVEHFETIRLGKGGRLVSISLSVSPILNADGVVVGASKIARDISDRKLAEQQRYCPILENSLLGSMGVPVKVIVDGQSVFVCCPACVESAKENPSETGRKPCRCQPPSCCSEMASIRRTSCLEYFSCGAVPSTGSILT